MVIRECILKGTEILRASGAETAALDARVLMCYILDKDDVYVVLKSDEQVDKDNEERYFCFVKRRAKGEPVAYITGEKEFMSLKFCVDPRVLIPRPDTEHLAELAIEIINEKNLKNVADFCTGSGAIAVTVAKNCPETLVRGYDISSDALEVAEKNKLLHNADNLSFETLDVLTDLSKIGETYDMVVSNPPYIDKADMSKLDNNVKDFEPQIALFGGEDGLDFYRAISDGAHLFLRKGGILAFEVGYNQAEDVKRIMSIHFDKVKIKKDYSGIERVVWGELR